MAETKKFTQEELDKVKEIQDSYFSVQNELGSLALTEIRIKESKSTLHDRLKAIQSDERTFLDGITKKYGQGSLNPENGEFTPEKSE